MARTRTRTTRAVDYWNLSHPFTPQAVFSDDAIARLHVAALGVLERDGIQINLPEARDILAAAGAIIRDQMVYIGRDLVTEALCTAPQSWRMRAANPAHERLYAPGQLLFGPGSGCPNITDRIRGRRPGSLADYRETIVLQQSFDVIHFMGLCVEPQDVPLPLRHYEMMGQQLTQADKPMFVFARGRGQVSQSFEMIRTGLNLSEEDWASGTWAYTVINSNSPRQFDTPMAQGIIDFARAGQMLVITPFCLAGAMAPVTMAGALVLQHAEALAGITLAQITRPGAPVSYGGFSSNVDMKSGAPAFGTPEHLKMQIGSGQLARHIGLPWRSASGAASNAPDMQSAQETTMAIWGALMGQATMVLHAAGWLEGGLTFGYEKFINDIEMLQSIAEICVRPGDSLDDLALDAIAEVPPGGHFFAAAHTMQRYEHAFYPPLLADLSNFGSWTAAGARDSAARAAAIWQKVLADFTPPAQSAEIADRLAPYIETQTKAGGAPPLD